jgi:kumamolisin
MLTEDQAGANTPKRPSRQKTFDKLVPLLSSNKVAPAAQPLKTLSSDELMNVTIRLVRKKSAEEAVSRTIETSDFIPRGVYASQYGADPADARLVEAFAHDQGLTIVKVSLARRSVILRGSVQDMSRSFGVYLSNYQSPDGSIFRGRAGVIQIPEVLQSIVEGVFGLDNRPVAHPHFQINKDAESRLFVPHAPGSSFNPNDLAKLYNFPTGFTGKGQCVAIIELGGGYRTKDLKAYFASLGIKTPVIKAISVDGAANSPSTADSADGEVMLDIEVVGAVAPEAKIVVYFAPNTDQGFLNAITTALHDNVNKPSVISISWGAAESQWTQQSLNSYNQAFQSAVALGVTILAAAGDTGSGDSVGDGKAHVDFPSSSPFVVACGGTKLLAGPTGIISETVWHASANSSTGGGVSDAFNLPSYQANANVPKSVNNNTRVGRGVPDLSAVADPATGYNVRVDGQNFVIGGTSAVAPLVAGLLLVINQKLGRRVGFIHPKIYANPAAFRDITIGDNITVPLKGYKAAKGWDACTGLGVADGVKLANIL